MVVILMICFLREDYNIRIPTSKRESKNTFRTVIRRAWTRLTKHSFTPPSPFQKRTSHAGWRRDIFYSASGNRTDTKSKMASVVESQNWMCDTSWQIASAEVKNKFGKTGVRNLTPVNNKDLARVFIANVYRWLRKQFNPNSPIGFV